MFYFLEPSNPLIPALHVPETINTQTQYKILYMGSCEDEQNLGGWDGKGRDLRG